MTSPVISVIMSVYREPIPWLEEAIESILHQTYSDFEYIIVIDDPSNTEILDCVGKFAAQDIRIRMVPNAVNKGLAKSLNRGLSLAKGTYIARMDGDDISLPERFEKQLAFMEANPGIALCGTQIIRINESGQAVSMGDYPSDPTLLKRLVHTRSIATHPSYFGRKEVFDELGGYRPFPAAQDYDFLYRLIDAGHLVSNLPERLFKFRLNAQSISHKKVFIQRMCGRYIKELHLARIHTGSDSFSLKTLDARIEAAQPQKESLQVAQQSFTQALSLKKQGKYIKALFLFGKSYVRSRLFREAIHNILRSKWIIAVYQKRG